MIYDLLLKAGTVIDPSQGLHAERDVAFSDGKVAAIAEDIPESEAREVVDCEGNFITPGLVDLHTHVYWGATNIGIDADELGRRSGCTTFVDAGTAGHANWRGFREFIIDRARARILTFVHISRIGLVDVELGECRLLDACEPEKAAEVFQANKDICVGIKVRMGKRIVGENGMEPLRLCIRAAEIVGTRVMVHIGNTVRPVPEILDLLRPGDIITHCFTGAGNGILTEKTSGSVLKEAREAREKGIIFDVGHGAGSFHFETARCAIDDGFLPDVISSDVHKKNIKGCVIDLPTTMSKFLNLGMSLYDVIERVTIAPAKAIGQDDSSAGSKQALGSLRLGSVGDAAVFWFEEGEFEFCDSHGNTMRGNKRLTCCLTVKDGKVWGRRKGKKSATEAQSTGHRAQSTETLRH